MAGRMRSVALATLLDSGARRGHHRGVKWMIGLVLLLAAWLYKGAVDWFAPYYDEDPYR